MSHQPDVHHRVQVTRHKQNCTASILETKKASDMLLSATVGQLMTTPAISLLHVPDKPLERQLADEQLRGLLVLPDFTECNGSRAVSMRLLDSASSRRRLASSLGGQLLPGGLAASGLASSLLGTSHLVGSWEEAKKG
jgi:hypothetical protein